MTSNPDINQNNNNPENVNPEIESLLDQFILEEIEIVEALKEIERESLIPQRPHGRQKLFLQGELKEAREVMYGGAAGGMKSSALLMSALEYIHIPNYAALILRRTFADLSLPDAIMDRAKQWLIGKPGVKWDAENKTFSFACPGSSGKSTLTFGYLESEVDKFRYQGSAYQFVGFDELTQFLETQYLYLFSRQRRPAIPCQNCMTDMKKDKATGNWIHSNDVSCTNPVPQAQSFKQYSRLYDVPLRTRSASNPGGVGHEWVKARFIPEDYSGPEDETIWYKEGVTDEGHKFSTAFVPSRLQDNPFIDQQTYEDGLGLLDRVTKRQLLYGDWAISPTGQCYFNIDSISMFKPVQPAIGELIEIENELGEKQLVFSQRPGGNLAIWKKPQKGRAYVMGCDTASGKDANKGEGKVSRDYSVAQIRDLDSGEQVARYRAQVSERIFGEMWYRISKFYNGAFVVPAVTGGYGRAALNRATDCGLPLHLIYCQEDETGIPGKRKGSSSSIDLGFTETVTTRPTLYSTLDLAIIQHAIETYDSITINEYYSFEYNKDGKPEARAGCKDDCVTADALSVKGIRVAPKFMRESAKIQSNVISLPTRYGQAGMSDEERRRQVQEIRRRNSIANFRKLQNGG